MWKKIGSWLLKGAIWCIQRPEMVTQIVGEIIKAKQEKEEEKKKEDITEPN